MKDDGDPHGDGEPGVVVRHVVPGEGEVRLHWVMEGRVSDPLEQDVETAARRHGAGWTLGEELAVTLTLVERMQVVHSLHYDRVQGC